MAPSKLSGKNLALKIKDTKINRVLMRTQEFIDMVESLKGDLVVARMVDVSYYLQQQEELRTLTTVLAESTKRVEHLDHLLRQKYSAVVHRWQKEQRALNRHLANLQKSKSDSGATVL